VAAILLLRFDCIFLIEETMAFALSLGNDIDDEWFGSEPGVDQIVEYMHSSLQG